MSNDPQHTVVPYPLSIAADPHERMEAGHRVADLLEHPGWADLCAGIRAFQGDATHRLTTMSPSQDGATYADQVGEIKGVGRVQAIAAGLVVVGSQAEEEIKIRAQVEG